MIDESANPFAGHASRYAAKGWPPFPLWDAENGHGPRGKANPAPGVTGRTGVNATTDQIQAWVARDGYFNIGIRMPDNVIVIDVDAYKGGSQTLAALEAELGTLPPTWSATARTDGSGHRYYRVPGRRIWANPGDGIEVLHWGWRYAVAPPSVNPDTGTVYRWFAPDGSVSTGIPTPDELTELPAAWVDRLNTREDPNDVTAKADLTWSEADAAVALMLTDGDPCEHMRRALDRVATSPDGRHDTCMRTQMVLLKYSQEGHPGGTAAMDELGEWFRSVMTRTSVESEWTRGQRDAVGKILGAPGEVTGCVDYVPPTLADKFRQASGLPPLPTHNCEADGCHRPKADTGDRATDGAARGADGVDPDEEFWKARPEFSHTRQYAQACGVSPWAMLGNHLARVLAAVPPNVRSPRILSTPGSLNLLVAITGRPGDGKGESTSAAREAMPIFERPVLEADRPAFYDTKLGSGPGITKVYMHNVPSDPDNAKSPKEWQQFRTRALFTNSEIDAFAANAGQKSATLLPELRSAYSGEQLGAAYSEQERNVQVPGHAYRFCMVVGVQPLKADALLDDAGGGTPQRFLWFPACDPLAPDVEPPLPDPVTWIVPDFGDGLVVIGACETVINEVRTERKIRLRGQGDGMAAHITFTRIKVACALSIWDGRRDVTEDDWALSAVIISKSNQTRESIETAVNRDRQGRAAAKRHEAALTAQEVEQAQADQRLAAAERRVQLLLEVAEDWVSAVDIRRKMSTGYRGLMQEALDKLITNGVVVAESTEKGHRYRVA